MGEAYQVLDRVFGYSSFRAGQAEAVAGLLEGQDVAVLLPTGGGKSLCYQVPGLVQRARGAGTAVVVSPLIALMDDQVRALQARGVRAAAMHSHLDDEARRAAFSDLMQGRLDFLYVSPERAALASFRGHLGRIPVGLLAIDEAHCISQWGHDFRPEYLKLSALRAALNVPTIAVTATATPKILDEVIERLGLSAPVVVRGDFARPNLHFSVTPRSRQAERLAYLVERLNALGFKARQPEGRAIVYCASRKKAQDVAKALKAAGIAAGYYHAGRTALARERAQTAFERGRTHVLVATCAFGMGIDYPDVRLIVHFQCPGSLEAYYQEAGRAGRDGAPAWCELLYGAGDLVLQRRLATSGSGASAARAEQAIRAVRAYAEGVECRQAMLIQHFTGVSSVPPCGACDVCTGAVVEAPASRPVPAPVASLDDAAKTHLWTLLQSLSYPLGKSTIAKAARGSRTKAIRQHRLDRAEGFGKLKAESEASIVATLEAWVRDGRLVRSGQKYPTVWPKEKPRASGAPARKAPGTSDMARALERYRRKQARALKWRPYMVFQRKVILALERERPESLRALERIPGLGPAKVERFGEDLLRIIEQN